MDYGQRLRDLRVDKDMTQAEIAKILGTTQSYYSQYELGSRPMPADRLCILCRYYGVSSDYILGLPEGLSYGLSKTKKSEHK